MSTGRLRHVSLDADVFICGNLLKLFSENNGKNEYHQVKGGLRKMEIVVATLHKNLDYDNQDSLCILLKRLNGIQIRQNIFCNYIWCGFKFPSKQVDHN